METEVALQMHMLSVTSLDLSRNGGHTQHSDLSPHIKKLFHGKTSVTDQLVFVTDVIQTLQIVQRTLQARESDTLDYICKVTGRANMIQQGESVYSIGKIKHNLLKAEYTSKLSLPTSAPIFQFSNGRYTIASHTLCRSQTKTSTSIGQNRYEIDHEKSNSYFCINTTL